MSLWIVPVQKLGDSGLLVFLLFFRWGFGIGCVDAYLESWALGFLSPSFVSAEAFRWWVSPCRLFVAPRPSGYKSASV